MSDMAAKRKKRSGKALPQGEIEQRIAFALGCLPPRSGEDSIVDKYHFLLGELLARENVWKLFNQMVDPKKDGRKIKWTLEELVRVASDYNQFEQQQKKAGLKKGKEIREKFYAERPMFSFIQPSELERNIRRGRTVLKYPILKIDGVERRLHPDQADALVLMKSSPSFSCDEAIKELLDLHAFREGDPKKSRKSDLENMASLKLRYTLRACGELNALRTAGYEGPTPMTFGFVKMVFDKN